MPEYVAIHPRAQVNGTTIQSIIDGVSFKSIAVEILLQCGIDKPRPGMWYSQQYWLDAIREISGRFWPSTLRSIGSRYASTVTFSSEVDSLEKALASIDMAYHASHRIDGTVLYDSRTGALREGIGHYIYKRSDNPQEAVIICQNPHPCEFDRGFITKIASAFQLRNRTIRVIHNDDAPCRKNGDETCEYSITWDSKNVLNKQNCWEAFQCGYQSGGRNIHMLGICPAGLQESIDGIHGGKYAGRACWAVAGTFCGNRIQGTSALKWGMCRNCGFFWQVRKEERRNYFQIKDIVTMLYNNESALLTV